MFPQKSIGGLALGVVFLLIFGISSASALSFNLNAPNAAISSFSAPYANVTVSLNTTTHDATITFTRYDSYKMGGHAAVALNLNGAATLVSGSLSWTGGNARTAFSLNGSRNVSEFGRFNFTLRAYDGFNSAVTQVVFRLHNTSWTADTDVLAANTDGYRAASHIFVAGCGTNACATGYAADRTLVPEPSTLLLLGSGLIAAGVWGRKKFMKMKSRA